MDPPLPWEEWRRLFQLAIFENEVVDIENLLNPMERHHPHLPELENPTETESENQKKAQPERNMEEQKKFDDEEVASIKTETEQFNGMRIGKVVKKRRLILYLAFGNEVKMIIGQKFTWVNILQISF